MNIELQQALQVMLLESSSKMEAIKLVGCKEDLLLCQKTRINCNQKYYRPSNERLSRYYFCSKKLQLKSSNKCNNSNNVKRHLNQVQAS